MVVNVPLYGWTIDLPTLFLNSFFVLQGSISRFHFGSFKEVLIKTTTRSGVSQVRLLSGFLEYCGSNFEKFN